MADFNKVGLLSIVDNRVLFVRKKRLGALILPGGCLEPGETNEDCLRREIREELGPDVVLDDIAYIGVYEDIAASDDPAVRKTVRIALYQGTLSGNPRASSEIVELVWLDQHSASEDWTALSPILRNKIIPDLIDRGMLAWPEL
jgi:8-oxo-dGTP pyrophosphatase MutT (NUDIX family)